MCFSAEASFGLGSILLAGGVVAVKSVKVPSQFAFACIPLIFGVQQLVEGVVWLSIHDSRSEDMQQLGTYIFMTIAQVLWPLWVPFSVWLMEKEGQRKKILTVIMIMGLIASLYLLYCLISYPVSSSALGSHIQYTIDFPRKPLFLTGLFYFIPTVISLFVSNIKNMGILAITILISFIASRIFFLEYFISVWCFFAAAISVVIIYILKTQDEQKAVMV